MNQSRLFLTLGLVAVLGLQYISGQECSTKVVVCPAGTVRKDLIYSNRGFFTFSLSNDKFGQYPPDALYPQGAKLIARSSAVWMARVGHQTPKTVTVYCASGYFAKAKGITLVLKDEKFKKGRIMYIKRKSLPFSLAFTLVNFDLPVTGVTGVEKIKLKARPDIAWDLKNIHMIICH